MEGCRVVNVVIRFILGKEEIESEKDWENPGPDAVTFRPLMIPYLKETVLCGVSKEIVAPF